MLKKVTSIHITEKLLTTKDHNRKMAQYLSDASHDTLISALSLKKSDTETYYLKTLFEIYDDTQKHYSEEKEKTFEALKNMLLRFYIRKLQIQNVTLTQMESQNIDISVMQTSKPNLQLEYQHINSFFNNRSIQEQNKFKSDTSLFFS